MHILVIGAGGVGGYFGAALARAGNDVTFLARGSHLRSMQIDGLKITSPKGDFQVKSFAAVEDLEHVTTVDVILLAVKAWQVTECLYALNHLKANHFMVVPLQNGVESYDEISKVVGPQRVVGGSCKIISYMAEPGHIVHVGVEPEIVFNEWDNRVSERVEKFAQCLRNAGIKCDVAENIQTELWKKFMFLAAYAGVGSVSRAEIGRIRSSPLTRNMLQSAMQEIFDLAQAAGVSLPPDLVPRSMAYVETMPPEATSSMQRDILAGKPSELEYLSGSVVRLAGQYHEEAPTHAFIYAALLPQENLARHRESVPAKA
jgi:2-dehydropantoate 2-reductase